LHRTAVAARPSSASGLTFALAPEWSGNEWLTAVHNFLHAFAASAPHRLWITADPQQIGLRTVLERLQPLLLPFGDRPFAEIFLSETPPAAGTALPLSSDRGRVHDYGSEWFRAQVQAASASRPRDPLGAKVYW
jgi:hypothetical protein